MNEDLLLICLFQWRDNKQVYGLNFSSKDDADVFANAMIRALEVISDNLLDGKSNNDNVFCEQDGTLSS